MMPLTQIDTVNITVRVNMVHSDASNGTNDTALDSTHYTTGALSQKHTRMTRTLKFGGFPKGYIEKVATQ